MKHVLIVGATSGIGLECARIFHRKGWTVGLMGRRVSRLEEISAELGERVYAKQVDITEEGAESKMLELIEEMVGADVIFHVAGYGHQNPDLGPDIEMDTAMTNVAGFVRVIGAAYRYFAENGGGHIAAVTSVAGTKGIGSAPAYSATKRFQSTYLQALSQLSRMRGTNICFTDIRPGFVDTALLKTGTYPMLMSPQYVAGLAVRAICRKRRKVVIDWRYAVLTFFWRLVPDCIWERMNIHN